MGLFKNSISLEDAKKFTKRWRNYYADTYNAYPQKKNKSELKKIKPDDQSVFRGFFISIQDLVGIKEILDAYSKLNPGAPSGEEKNGIRVYLAKKNEYISEEKNMHVLIVPVINGEDIVNLSVKVNDNKTNAENASLDTESTIFDFSSPCPETCDPKSSLY